MKKLLLYLVFFSIFTVSWSQEKADSARAKLEASATISLNSNGIAYIPAFSLDKPAIIGAFTLAKGRLSYDPILAYGLDLRPWIIDNWLHYKIIDKPVFELKAGIIISAFFGIIDKIVAHSRLNLSSGQNSCCFFSPCFIVSMIVHTFGLSS